MTALITALRKEDIKGIAEIWHQGWHDAHAEIVPEELTQQRTLDSFRRRLRRDYDVTRVYVDASKIHGFSIIKSDELNQFYVAPSGRGRGIAQKLIDDAEQEMRTAGFSTAWLSCSVGNDRAARFYEKAGWTLAEERRMYFEATNGDFPLDVWRFEKRLIT